MCDRCTRGVVSSLNDDGSWALVYCDCYDGLAARYRGIADEALYWTFDSFPGDKKACARVQEALRAGRWVLLMGDYGTGKSSLASCAFKQAVDRCLDLPEPGIQTTWIVTEKLLRPVQYWNVKDLMMAIKETFDDPMVQNPLDYLHNRCRFLVLDGLGESEPSAWELATTGQLIGRRYESWQRMRTIITTNYDPSDIRNRLGGWVYDRLRDVAETVIITGESMRGKHRQQPGGGRRYEADTTAPAPAGAMQTPAREVMADVLSKRRM